MAVERFKVSEEWHKGPKTKATSGKKVAKFALKALTKVTRAKKAKRI